MKLLFTGSGGHAGSWHMRGVQMAATHKDWVAIPKATKADLVGADAVVLVKRAPKDTVAAIKAWGGPFLYDALDFWKQPEGASGIGSAPEACMRFQKHFSEVDADIVLTPNTIMKFDLEPICKKTAVLPHHFDPSISPNPRKHSRTVVYWGHPRYLEGWREIADRVCRRVGAELLVNPKDPTVGAMMLAVRGGPYGSWLDRRWKSGVKGVTAMALGVPLVAWPELSYTEFCGSHLKPFTNEVQLETGLLEGLRGGFATDTTYSVENMAKVLEGIISA